MSSARRVFLLVMAILFVLLINSASATSTTRLTIASTPAGSLITPMSELLAQLITRNVANVEASVLTSPGPGSPENLRLIGQGRADLALIGNTLAQEAVLGQRNFEGNPVRILSIAPLWDVFVHLATVDGTGVQRLTDLRGKRVNLGLRGSAVDFTARRVLKAAGIDPDREVQVEYSETGAAASALREGRIHAFFVFSAVPQSDLVALANSPGVRINLVPLDEILPALRQESGNLYRSVKIRKEFYSGLTRDVQTFGYSILLVARPDLTNELAYHVTRLVYEYRQELARAYNQAQYITLLGAAQRSVIPYHPGAARYFRERGVEGF